MYRQRAFDAEVIQLCVRWYITKPSESALSRLSHP
jgi:transposase-like protein